MPLSKTYDLISSLGFLGLLLLIVAWIGVIILLPPILLFPFSSLLIRIWYNDLNLLFFVSGLFQFPFYGFVFTRLKTKIRSLYAIGLIIGIHFGAVVICIQMLSLNDNKFDKEVWADHNDMNQFRNPRRYMTDDLLENYLKPGMPKDSVIGLLGKPYQDQIFKRLPKGLNIPDSISINSAGNRKNPDQDLVLDKYNSWMNAQSQPDTLILYPVGWSTIDPNFLVVKFDDKKIAYEFWVEQH